jgi:hypothetical protein
MSNRLFSRISFVVVLGCASLSAMAAGDVALITALQGKVSRVQAPAAPVPVDAFVKLKEGDSLKLEKDASLKLVFFDGGRQETWTGAGQIAIGANEGKGTGLPAPTVTTLPPLLVKQIAKTPALDSQGRGGVTRLRAIATPEALAKLEADYDAMRVAAGGNDLNAEMFLLAGLYEMKELERLDVVLKEVEVRYKDNNEAKVLVALYRKTLSSTKLGK